MLALLLGVQLAASSHSLAMPKLNGVRLEEGAAALYTELFAQEMVKHGAKVMTSRDIAAVLGLERERQLAGCSDNHACLAELTGALGVEGLVLGDVGNLGQTYVVNLKVLSARDGSALALFHARVSRSDQVPGALSRAAWELTAQLRSTQKWADLIPGTEPVLDQSSDEQASTSRWWAVVPAAVAVAGIAVGITAQVQADAKFRELQQAPSVVVAQTARSDGRAQETLSLIGFGAAGAGVAAAVILLTTGGQSSNAAAVHPSVLIAPSGATFGLTGEWP